MYFIPQLLGFRQFFRFFRSTKKPNTFQIGNIRLQQVLFHATSTCLYAYWIQIQSIRAKVGAIRPLDASQKDGYPTEKRLIGKRGKNSLPDIRGNIKTLLFAVDKFQQQDMIVFRFHRFYTRVHFAYFKGSIWKILVPLEAKSQSAINSSLWISNHACTSLFFPVGSSPRHQVFSSPLPCPDIWHEHEENDADDYRNNTWKW